VILVALLGLHSCDSGRMSVYAPGDGNNRGVLSCGGAFSRHQVHIAYRGWRRVGCGRVVVVCSSSTGACAMATVRDAGPYGLFRGRLRESHRPGRWRLAPRAARRTGRAPRGWQWRGKVDLSLALWVRLGRPRFLSQVQLLFLPRRPRVS